MGRRIHLQLRIDQDLLDIEAPAPPDHSRLDELLPTLRAIDNAAIGNAVARSEAAGRSVSCRKGCSACCRAQPVPVTPTEAQAIKRLVESMPEARRSTVTARFEARVDRLREAGLLPVFLNPPARMGLDEARKAAEAYFQLGLVCPFLDDDACSIHPHRPFVCRQYLVTSDPALCTDPLANPVEVIPMPLSAAGAMLDTAAQALGRRQHTVPLVLALLRADADAHDAQRRFPAEQLLRTWLESAGRK